MSDADFHLAVFKALDQARPDAAVTVLRPLLAEHLQASQVRLLLANYQLTALRPVGDPDDRVVLRDTPAGEAFVTQCPVTRTGDVGETLLCLPVSIRGDRLGVLELALPAESSPLDLESLGELATVIGYALQAAARQTDAVQRAARSQRLTLAAELQWQLLPGRGCQAPEYQLAGHLEPAYHVHADNFDWSQDGDQLTLSVTDAARHDRCASLLTTLAVTALRNARRAELEIAEQVSMADQAVYAHHLGKQYVSALVVGIDLSSGRARAVRAGSPQLYIQRGDEVLQPPLSDQLPLGMFDGTEYAAEHFALVTGDRLLMVSDGVHAARSPAREHFGGGRLPQLLRASTQLTVGGVVRRVVDELFEHLDLAELHDDAAVICLDWAGPGRADSVEALPRAEEVQTGRAPRTRGGLSIVPHGAGGEGERRAAPPSSAFAHWPPTP